MMESAGGLRGWLSGAARLGDRVMRYELASTGYTRLQIGLHWAVVALIIVQLLTSDGMDELLDELERGRAADPGDTSAAWLHMASGLTILGLAITRIALRWRNGAPPPPEDLPLLFRLAGWAAHLGLYALLLALPFTGALTVWADSDFGDMHEALTLVLWALIAAHVAAALFHGIVRRDGVFSRMLRPAR